MGFGVHHVATPVLLGWDWKFLSFEPFISQKFTVFIHRFFFYLANLTEGAGRGEGGAGPDGPAPPPSPRPAPSPRPRRVPAHPSRALATAAGGSHWRRGGEGAWPGRPGPSAARRGYNNKGLRGAAEFGAAAELGGTVAVAAAGTG